MLVLLQARALPVWEPAQARALELVAPVWEPALGRASALAAPAPVEVRVPGAGAPALDPVTPELLQVGVLAQAVRVQGAAQRERVPQ